MNSSRSNPAVRLAPEGAHATSTSAPLIAALIEMSARTPETGITYPNAVDGWRGLYRQRHARGLAATFLQQGMHLARHWWEAGNHPRPSKATIAKRMGCDAWNGKTQRAQDGEGGTDQPSLSQNGIARQFAKHA